MAQPGVFTPFSTIAQYFGVLPSWVPPADQERIAAYQTYEEIYWNHPETFKLVLRGTENKAIYVPSGRTIVETANRYVGKGLRWVPEGGQTSDQENLMLAFNNLFARETFKSKYNANKRFGLIRGDWIFHVTADPLKPEGERISIHAVDPASYFPVYEDELRKGGNPNRVARVNLAEQFIDTDGVYGAKGKTLVRRQRYEKLEGTGLIESSTLIADPDKWFDDSKAGTVYEVRPFTLDERITQIPVFPIRNFDEPGNPFGSSEMRGLERLMAAINQAVSDTDISLALEGLGVYTTESGGPVDENGEEVDWIIGPGRVIENVKNFQRINGVSTVKPSQDHVNLLNQFIKEASGTPDAAIGKIDVQVAESGIALAMELAPILAKASEKDDIILDALAQFAYNLSTMWFPVYEGQNFGEARLVPVLSEGDKLPKNRKAILEEVTTMMMTDPPLMSATTGRQILASELGIPFASDELTRIIQEQAAMLEAAPDSGSSADPEGDRLNAEDTGDGGTDAA